MPSRRRWCWVLEGVLLNQGAGEGCHCDWTSMKVFAGFEVWVASRVCK